jgi:hypothetical protein
VGPVARAGLIPTQKPNNPERRTLKMHQHTPIHKMKRKPKPSPKVLARKREERQALRAFLYSNRDHFGSVKTAIKRVQDSLGDWEAPAEGETP